MTRLFLIIVCLASVAFARYQTEARVTDARERIAKIDRQQTEERRQIQLLRTDIAHLERPERLMEIANSLTTLRPTEGVQIISAADFAEALGDDAPAPMNVPGEADIINYAIAMADARFAE
ncbi:MAG: hypothetical protein AAF850_09690 [Pseudomonadota bacterium]